MRAPCSQRSIPIVIGSAAVQASLLTAPGGSYFSSPLGVALSSYTEDPHCRDALMSALNNLASSSEVRQLAQPGAPDQQPEAALVSNLCCQIWGSYIVSGNITSTSYFMAVYIVS